MPEQASRTDVTADGRPGKAEKDGRSREPGVRLTVTTPNGKPVKSLYRAGADAPLAGFGRARKRKFLPNDAALTDALNRLAK